MKRNITLLFTLLLLILLLPGCQVAAPAPARSLDSTPRLALLSAFDPELTQLRRESEIEQVLQVNGRSVYVGQLAGHAVVFLNTGVSMVNAAMLAQAILDRFNITAVLFTGIAGGVNPNLNIGDVVVPAQWGQYQEQLFARQTSQGWDTGQFSNEFGNFEMMFPQRVAVARTGDRLDHEENLFWFPVDAGLLDVAHQVVSGLQLKQCTPAEQCLGRQPRLVLGGNGVSGQTFVDNAEYRSWVWKTFQADALDMETAAVAQVAYANNVPFLAFRSLSDLAGGGPGENEINTFFQLAADNSATSLLAFLQVYK